MVKIIFLIGFICISSAFGEEEKKFDTAKEQVDVLAEKVEKALENSRTRRAQNTYLATINYAPLDLLIPSKIGFTLAFIRNADNSLELEYLRGKVSAPFVLDDLGSMSDQRISLIGRSYFGKNSFNLGYGASFNDFKVNIGSDILSRVGGGNIPGLDLLQLQTLGFHLSIGNRWHVKHNITFGVDWVSWSQPLFITKKQSVFLDHATNPEDRDDVDAALKLASYFPRFSFFKVQVGVLF